MSNTKSLSVFLNGILKENPAFVLVLGTCPTLATTTSAKTGVGMGIAAMAVLVCSNLAISLIRKIVPSKVRIPAYVIVIATFVTIVSMLLKAFAPELDAALGIFLPLIVVNCIILARAEAFASKNNAWKSILDGFGMGIGFTLALFCMGSIREILGAGSWFDIRIVPESVPSMGILSQAPGGFFVFGVLMALTAVILKKFGRKPAVTGCGSCPSKGLCQGADAIDETNKEDNAQ